MTGRRLDEPEQLREWKCVVVAGGTRSHWEWWGEVYLSHHVYHWWSSKFELYSFPTKFIRYGFVFHTHLLSLIKF